MNNTSSASVKKIFCLITSVMVLQTTGCSTIEAERYDPVTMDLLSVDEAYPPSTQELSIPANGVKLTGFLLGANGPGPHPSVVLLHGYPGNEKNLDLAQSMRRAGFNVLFFHYRGAWGSQGDFALDHLSDDVAAALMLLRNQAEILRVDTSRLSLVGHSMGGFAALQAGAEHRDVVCVVGMAAANLSEYASRDEAAQQGFSDYTDGLFMLRNFSGAKALSEIDRHRQDFDVHSYGSRLSGKSILLIAGAQDTVVPPTVQQRIAAAYEPIAGLQLTTRTIPGDHSFSSHRVLLQHNVVQWLSDRCR